jgi:hypothetical protein
VDIDTNDLYLDIDFNRTYLMDNYIPFDSYWAPGRADGTLNYNMKHIEVTPDLYRWLVEHIDRNDDLRHPQTGAYHKTLSGYYNFGQPGGTDWDKPFLKHLYTVDIVNGGNLHINKNGVIGYPGGNYFTNSNSSFTCYTGQNCEQPLVRVQNSGLFEVGDNLGNKADMHFRANSTLEIENGGTLRVNDNSTLIIEPDAELIIHPGAILDLAGPNAVLELQGKVTLLPGASLSPSGTGVVRFAQAMDSVQDVATYWHLTSNNHIRITGSNQAVRTEVLKPLFLPNGLDSVVFKGISVLLSPAAEVHMRQNKVKLYNSAFVGADTTQQHYGIHLSGFPAIVQNSRFSHGSIGLANVLTAGSETFVVTNSLFTHNTIGLLTHDGAHTLINCTLKNNSTAWEADAAQGNSAIQGGKISYNTSFGVQFNGQAGSNLYASELACNNNGIGLHVNTANLQALCCNFNSSNVGIAAEGGSFISLHKNAQNLFTNCATAGVALYSASGIFLADGYNDFSGSTWYVQGELTPVNANPNIDVLNNDMPGSTSGQTNTVPINVYWRNAQGQQVQIPLANWAIGVTLPATCAPPPGGANPGNDLANDIMMGFASAKVVNTTNYSNWWLHEALADAAYKVSDANGTYADLLAIARFSEILNGVNEPFTENEEQAFNYSAELMITALNNAFEQGLVPQNEGQESQLEHPYLQLVTDQLNGRIASTGLSAEEIFNMSLALAQTYRMAEHYDYALNILDSVASPTTPTQLVHTDYWECVCLAESALMNGEISTEDFVIEQENCRSMLSQYYKWQSEISYGYSEVNAIDANVKLIAPLYPNPANSGVIISIIDQSAEIELSIFDLSGKLIQTSTIAPNTHQTVIDVKELGSGSYMLSVKQRDVEQIERLVIAR